MFAKLNRANEITLHSLEAGFICFGEFVEDLTFKCLPLSMLPIQKNSFLNSKVIVMKYCTNLIALRFEDYKFRVADSCRLLGVIKRFQYLKELEFRNCTGLPKYSLAAVDSVSKVNKLTCLYQTALRSVFLSISRIWLA